MKTLSALFAFLALPLTVSAADPASKDIFTCVVPVDSGSPAVSMTVSMIEDANADFVVVTVLDKGTTFRMFSQQGKGSVSNDIAAGSLVMMVLDDNFAQDAGVVRNSGVMVINRAATGAYSGLMAAHSNIYSLACTPK